VDDLRLPFASTPQIIIALIIKSMASTDDDEFNCSSGDEAALLQALKLLVLPKRKLAWVDDDVPNSAKRQRENYPATSELAKQIPKEIHGLNGLLLKREAAISRVIAGGSSVIVFPTGDGKSRCYQVSALAFAGRYAEEGFKDPLDASFTIVVSPLIALMKDQIDALRKRGINAVAINSTPRREELLPLLQI
jgi:hypothetical protein